MTQLPGYTLLSRLHVGSHFQVHRAMRLEDQTLVCVKFPVAGGLSREAVSLLAREYAILSLLAGRGAVKALGLDRFDAFAALVLEDMDGRRLSEIAGGGDISLRRFLDLAVSAADALDLVHKAGVRHGDVTAANILVSRLGPTSRFLDFGAGFRAGLPLDRQPIGRPTHLAPELAGQPQPRPSPATDIYALGVTLHELLTGRLPFESADPRELVHAHLAKAPDDLRSIRADLPGVVSDIVLKCLAKDPGRRYRTAAGLAFDLRRCLDREARQEPMAFFDLGASDDPGVPEAPATLVGRRAEMLALAQAFDRAADGAFETVLIHGPSGMGKTRLVEELKNRIWDRRVFFLEGKWETLRRDAPYLALSQALSRAVRRILGLPERELAAWRQRLTQAMGDDAGLLVKAIPELALVIETRQRASLNGPREAKTRLARLYGAMLWTLSFYSRSVVLFLDDLHRADADSLDLLKALLWDSNASNCLVLLTYREDALARNPAAATFVRALAENGKGRVSTIALKGLTRAAVAQYLGMALGRAADEVAEEAAAFHEKTGGAPYFMAELLRHGAFREQAARPAAPAPLGGQGVPAASGEASLARIAVARIDALPELDRQALRLAACLGSRFDARIPARALGVGEEQALSLFRSGLDLCILLPDEERDTDEAHRGRLPMRFAHDLALEATYASLPPSRRAEAHELLARCLLGFHPPHEHPAPIYAIADQILLCGRRLETTPDRTLFADALGNAAREAVNAAAFPAAWTFAAAGMRLLGRRRPGEADRLALDLWRTGAQAALSAGLDQEFETVSAQGLALASDAEDKAYFLALRARRHVRAGRHEAAASEVRRALAFLGDENPGLVDPREKTLTLVHDLKALLHRRGLESVHDLPPLGDRRAMAELDVISAGMLSVLNVDTGLHAYLMARAVLLQLKRGLYPPMFPAFSCLGNLIALSEKDNQAALALTELGLELGRKRRHPEAFLCTVDAMSRSELPRTRSLRLIEALFDEGFAMAESAGVSSPGCLYALGKVRLDFFLGKALASLIDALRRFAVEALGQGNRTGLLDCAAMYFGLKGLTDGKASTFADELTEGGVLRELTAGRQHMSLTAYKTCKMASSYLLKRYRAALALHNMAKAPWLTDKTVLADAPQRFYAAMSLLALCGEGKMAFDGERRDFVENSLGLFQELADQCPANFSSWLHLLRAEHSRVTGAPAHETVPLFERALRAARRNGFAQNEALGRELLGRFFVSRNRVALARPMLTQAIAGYRAWGAEKAAELLQDEFGPVLRPGLDESLVSGLETAPISLETLDLLTVLKSARIISAETNPNRLIPLLMGILAESAGAERGAFFSLGHGKLQLVAHSAERDPSRFELVRPGREPRWEALGAALRFVVRTGESLVLSDASADTIFGVEAKRRAAPARSLLCMPIPGFNGPVGLVYLENNQIPGAFTTSRLGVVRTLAAQAAVALENAALFDSLRMAEKKYRGIVDSAPLGIFQADREGRLTDANPALSAMLGFVSTRHLLASESRLVDFCLDPGDQRRLLKRQRADRDAPGLEMPVRRHDGSILWARLHVRTERDDADRIVRFLGMVEDITALKQSAEQLQRLNRDQLRIQEQERTRIAMDLHDNVAQDLLALKLALGQEAARPELAAVEGLAQNLKKLGAGLTASLSAVRDLSHALQPPDLDGLGLAGALESLCRERSAKCGAEVDFLAAGLESLDLPPQAQAHCYRLVQEGVNNALRHAGAARVTVRMTVSYPKLVIRIEDNGCGFDVAAKSAAALREKRMGLRGMRERAHILGGSLQIKSRVGEGTRILVEIASRREQHGD